MRGLLILVLLLSAVLSGSREVLAQQPARVSLLIGNQRYTDAVGPLRNPLNDIALVGRALAEVGFDNAGTVKDGSREDMLFGVHALASRLRRAGRGAIGFLYYTGNGVSVGGDNVLIPTNTASTSDAELSIRGVKLAEILDILQREAPDAVHFVVLDACRSNIRGQRGAKGFVPVSDQRTGVVIAFATAAGQTAADDGQGSGPYAAALAAEIVKPGRNDQAVFNEVRARVVGATRTQTPWTHDGLIGERVVFKATTTPAPPTPAVPATGWSTAEREWQQYAKDTRDLALLEAFKRKHAQDPVYVRLAEARIEAVQREAQAAATGERERVAALDLQRRQEAEKKAAEEATRPGRVFRDCPDKDAAGIFICPEMVVLPKGSCKRGSEDYADEKPVKPVSIGYTLAVAKFEATFAEWDACVKAGDCKHNPATEWGRGPQPVHSVSWDDVTKEYLPWLNRRLGLSGAGAYRLLTEAEWEYAARGVISASAPHPKYWWGDEASHEHANYGADACCSGLAQGRDKWVSTAPVGQFPQNPFGLHDMHGNVLEWVADCYADTYNNAPTDGSKAPETNACRRVVRGGSWNYSPGFLRSAHRGSYTAVDRFGKLGFRVGRTLSP